MKRNISTKIQRILIVLFIMLAILVVYFIFQIATKSKNDWVHHKSTNTTIVEIYGGYKGKPDYQIMKLADSQTFTIPKVMLYKIKIGDSVLKEKDSSFYIFTSNTTKEKLKSGWK